MKKILYIIPLIATLLTTTSCEDFLNITPEGQAKRDELLMTTEGLEEAMYGVYAQLRSTTLYGQELHFQTLEVMAHNMYCDGNTAIMALGEFDYQNTSVKSLFEGIWTTMYKNISNANSVLNSPLIIDAEEFPYTIYKGEALGLRAFMHFDLVRLFAKQYTLNPKADGIPYATEFSLKTPEFESLQKNYEHIIADLLEAERLLADEEKYEGEGNYMLDRQIHFNKYAVKATLARVYLTMGDKENAAKYAKEVIDGKKYYLKEMTEVEDDLAGVLSKKECIFGVYHSGFPWYSHMCGSMASKPFPRLYMPMISENFIVCLSRTPSFLSITDAWIAVYLSAVPVETNWSLTSFSSSSLPSMVLPTNFMSVRSSFPPNIFRISAS